MKDKKNMLTGSAQEALKRANIKANSLDEALNKIWEKFKIDIYTLRPCPNGKNILYCDKTSNGRLSTIYQKEGMKYIYDALNLGIVEVLSRV